MREGRRENELSTVKFRGKRKIETNGTEERGRESVRGEKRMCEGRRNEKTVGAGVPREGRARMNK